MKPYAPSAVGWPGWIIFLYIYTYSLLFIYIYFGRHTADLLQKASYIVPFSAQLTKGLLLRQFEQGAQRHLTLTYMHNTGLPFRITLASKPKLRKTHIPQVFWLSSISMNHPESAPNETVCPSAVGWPGWIIFLYIYTYSLLFTYIYFGRHTADLLQKALYIVPFSAQLTKGLLLRQFEQGAQRHLTLTYMHNTGLPFRITLASKP